MAETLHAEMHREHGAWASESGAWLDDIRLWQDELKTLQSHLQDFEKKVAKHAETLRKHAADSLAQAPCSRCISACNISAICLFLPQKSNRTRYAGATIAKRLTQPGCFSETPLLRHYPWGAKTVPAFSKEPGR